jgi:hypothetical protein
VETSALLSLQGQKIKERFMLFFLLAVREGTPRTEIYIIPHFSNFVKGFSEKK